MTEKKNIELLKVGRDVPLNPLSKRQIQKLVDSNLQIYKKYKRKTESLLFNFVNR